MASTITATRPNPFSLIHKRTNLYTPSINPHKLINFNSFPTFTAQKVSSFNHLGPNFGTYPLLLRATPNGHSSQSQTLESTQLKDPIFEVKPVKTALWVLFWASVSLAVFAFSKDAKAAVNVSVTVSDSSIRASSFGLKIANALRGSGWPDEAVVFALATLPVIELRGAIPVGYWMQLKPAALTALAILGNMVPVPFIVLYLKKVATFIAGKNRTASRILDMLFERAKEKAGPVEEFRWLGLMLFVAVPFPGTGAWSGAIIASLLDMPFWPAVSANFFGVVLAGLLVNLLVNLGLKYAIITGVILFLVSTFMWTVLRSIRKSLISTN